MPQQHQPPLQNTPLFSHPIDTSISTNPSGSSNVARNNRWTLTSNDPLYPVTSNDQMPQQHQPPRQNTPLFSHPIDTSISTNPSGSSNVARTNRWTLTSNDPLYPVTSNDQMPQQHQPPRQNTPLFSHPIDTSISTNPSGSSNVARNNRWTLTSNDPLYPVTSNDQMPQQHQPPRQNTLLFSHPIDTSISTNPSGSSNVARNNRWTLTSNDPLYPVTSNDQMPQQHQPPRQNTPLFSHPIDTSISTNPSGSSNVARNNRWTLTSNDPLYPVTSNDQMPQQHQPPLQNTPLFSHPIDTSICTNPSGSSNVARNNRWTLTSNAPLYPVTSNDQMPQQHQPPRQNTPLFSHPIDTSISTNPAALLMWQEIIDGP